MRIRSILPNFYRSEDVGAMDWDTRLIFISLWSYVDDNGVGRDIEQLLAADLFPYDDTRETVARLSRGLQALSDGGQIIRYTVANRRYLFIVAWDLYQRIDKPGKERYPRPEHEKAVIRDTVATPSRDSSETVVPGEGEKGRRGEGEKVTTLSVATAPNEFDIFYDLYPKKVNPKAARAKWLTVIKGTEPCVILAGIRAQLPQMAATDRQYIPAPDVWLNKGKWADEITPVAASGPQGWWNNQ